MSQVSWVKRVPPEELRFRRKERADTDCGKRRHAMKGGVASGVLDQEAGQTTGAGGIKGPQQYRQVWDGKADFCAETKLIVGRAPRAICGQIGSEKSVTSLTRELTGGHAQIGPQQSVKAQRLLRLRCRLHDCRGGIFRRDLVAESHWNARYKTDCRPNDKKNGDPHQTRTGNR